ncbi:hypothetical protein K493DRAFT_24160 [Basidiobolus meristosporus CBS 931.73]|uniref:C3H1-type domain-containing protein n=1 Tax=Basidiobolus meristosporus CBS 931.73 TaxID=1314790 RepID=A0A1Y1YC69_9FUNG|nr:hypothetical protein K493DRAFT_24160 [Basidiobolus meristosporus CBS 931.73]|eukprot:ORX95630.1 hypothetical protein K493DRAFT_24160 [Basidiobolus meristosporus CBS 931.73]
MTTPEQANPPTAPSPTNTALAPGQEAPKEPSKPARHRPVLCKFFSTPSGCRSGERCRYSHTIDATGNQAKRSNPRRRTQNKKTAPPPEKEAQPHKDEQIDGQSNTQNEPSDEAHPEKQEKNDSGAPRLTTRQTELGQIRRRFKDSYVLEPASTEVAPCFRIKLVPSDPEFPFELDSLEIRISLPEKYYNTEENLKEGVPHFEVLNKEIPESLKRSVVDFMKKDSERLLTCPPAFLRARARSQNGTIQILRPMLNKLDRELANLLIEKPKAVSPPPKPKPIPAPVASGTTIKFVKNDTPKPNNAASDRVQEDLNDLFSQSMTISQRESEDELAISNVTKELPLYQPREAEEPADKQNDVDSENKEGRFRNSGTTGCYEIKATDFHMEGVALAESILLSLSLKCVKCTTATKTTCTVDLDLVPGKEVSNTCTNGKCGGLQVTAKFQPGMLHPNSDILGTIVIHPPYIFQPYDLLPSTYRLTCSSCPVPDDDDETPASNGITARRLARSKIFNQRCHTCHENNVFSIDTVRFTSVSGDVRPNLKLSDTAKVGLKKKKKKELEELGLAPGQPLPDKGTCKHYKKSYRWLTFPCCGKSYPCDQCHDDKSDHETQVSLTILPVLDILTDP